MSESDQGPARQAVFSPRVHDATYRGQGGSPNRSGETPRAFLASMREDTDADEPDHHHGPGGSLGYG